MKLNVWRFSDGLSGHDAQSNGLCLAIKDIVSIEQFDLDIDSIKNCLKNLLLKKFSNDQRISQISGVNLLNHRGFKRRNQSDEKFNA